MSTMEVIILITGIVVALIGFVLVFANFANISAQAYVAPYILLFAGLIAVIVAIEHYEIKTTETVSEGMVIKIEDMRTTRHTCYAGKSVIYNKDYWVYFENDGRTERVEVSSSIYRDYSVGDTIVIQKHVTYKIDRETKERLSIVSVSYN